MFWICIIIVLLGGVLAAAPTIVGKKPAAKEYIDKIRPAKGWIGIVLIVLGIIWLIQILPYFTYFIRSFYGIATLSVIFVGMIGNGFLLGYELIVQYTMSGSDAAKEKAEAIRAKLAPIEASLGMVAIGGALTLIFYALRMPRMF